MSDIPNILFMANDFGNKCQTVTLLLRKARLQGLVHMHIHEYRQAHILVFHIPLSKKLTYNFACTNNNNKLLYTILYTMQTKVFFTSYSDNANFKFIYMKMSLLTVVKLRI